MGSRVDQIVAIGNQHKVTESREALSYLKAARGSVMLTPEQKQVALRSPGPFQQQALTNVAKAIAHDESHHTPYDNDNELVDRIRSDFTTMAQMLTSEAYRHT